MESIDRLSYLPHLWNCSASDGLNKFFQTTFHNNNRRIKCSSVSHNMHYLIFCDISEG